MEKIERDTSLTRLGIMAKRHWEKWRPKMVVRLKEGEVYQDAILMAQNTAKEELVRRVSAGIPYHMAWEYVTVTWILLPAEDDQPNLSPDQMPFLAEK